MLEKTTLFLIINMLSGISYSLVSPLFPILGKKENLSEGVLGWAIGLFSVAGCIFTTIVPILGKKYSRIKLLSYANLFSGIVTIIYGLLIYISNKNSLIMIIYFLRIFHGCCSSIISTLVYSLTITFSKKGKTQSSLGKLEVAWGVGVSSGPLFASVFYKIGGYTLPFLITGILTFFPLISSFRIKDKKNKKNQDEEMEDNNYNYLKYLFYPEIYSILIGVVVGMISVTFFMPCLTLHLIKNYSVSVSIASLFFITPIIPYMIILQYLDRISAKLGIYPTFAFGLILSGISSLFIYPVPPLPRSFISIIIGFLLMGVGSVPVFIPGLVMLSKNIKKIDDSIDEMSANDIASAINNLCLDLGNFVGPILGGYLADNFGFQLCCFIITAIVIAYSAIFILFFFSKIKNDLSLFCLNEKSENNEEDIEEENNNDYFKRLKSNILMNKYTVQLIRLSYNKYKKNNNKERNSLCSSLTK